MTLIKTLILAGTLALGTFGFASQAAAQQPPPCHRCVSQAAAQRIPPCHQCVSQAAAQRIPPCHQCVSQAA